MRQLRYQNPAKNRVTLGRKQTETQTVAHRATCNTERKQMTYAAVKTTAAGLLFHPPAPHCDIAHKRRTQNAGILSCTLRSNVRHTRAQTQESKFSGKVMFNGNSMLERRNRQINQSSVAYSVSNSSQNSSFSAVFARTPRSKGSLQFASCVVHRIESKDLRVARIPRGAL